MEVTTDGPESWDGWAVGRDTLVYVLPLGSRQQCQKIWNRRNGLADVFFFQEKKGLPFATRSAKDIDPSPFVVTEDVDRRRQYFNPETS